ncbi:hypothetical protein BDV29DRAFT_159062 [Aspergillus leporis]|uniref:Extracellular membrane protein CFEM domain-containing protein n=1 Tax=Aspergillus leporis TaxID=41062 RepID=A0A5N5WXA5_9EURO|nr:hypothetical protein BDV29DRAFT_159062 [Aspergillus leporis]
MRFTTILLASLASLAASHPSANPDEATAAKACGWPNGNCYDNDCHGELSPNRITCTSAAHADMVAAGTPEDATKMVAMVAMAAAPTTTLVAPVIE